MTTNQIALLNYQELQRTNLAKEAETNRSNLARERETARSNVAQETLTRQNLLEQGRHNKEMETVSAVQQGVNVASSFFGNLANLAKLF